MMRLRRTLSRGYTSVEVLMAMTLFSIGAAGVIGMQRVAIQGNADARRSDVGAGISAEWLSRLRRDSMMWTQPNASIPTSNHASATIWLADTATLATPAPASAGWLLPRQPAGPFIGSSYAFDILGREVAPGSAETFYCVNYRLDWLVALTTIRAEVRVFWPRFEQAAPASCAPDVADATNSSQTYHFMYATTTLRRNAI